MPTFGSGMFGSPGAAASGDASTGSKVSELLYAGLRIAGITERPGRGPSPDQLNDAFGIFNRFMGGLNLRGTNIFTRRIDTYSLLPNVKAYTIGPGGDFDGQRPRKITLANFLLPTTPTIRRELHLLTDAEWAAIKLQDLYTYPWNLYNDGASPLAMLYFHPVPAGAWQFEIFHWQAMPTAGSADDTIELPPDSEEMVVYNLARRIATAFPTQAHMSEDSITIARESLGAYQRKNMHDAPKMASDAPGSRRGRGGFNWMSGT